MELMPLRRRKKNLQRKKKMEADPKVQNEAEVIMKPENPLSNLPKPVLIGGGLVLILATVAFVSYSLGSASKSQPVSEQKEPVVKVTDLPLPISTLQNPLIYEWQGSVEGVLVEKNDKNFTLEKDGKRITITVKNGYTAFYKQGATGSAKLTIKDVPEGTTVRGTVWLSLKGKLALSGVADDVVGGTFSFSTPQKK